MTNERSASGMGCSSTAVDDNDFLAASKAATVSTDQSNGWSPRGPPRSARVSGKATLAAAGMNFL